MKLQSCLFGKIHKIDKHLVRFIREKERAQRNKIGTERKEVTMDPTELQWIIRDN